LLGVHGEHEGITKCAPGVEQEVVSELGGSRAVVPSINGADGAAPSNKLLLADLVRFLEPTRDFAIELGFFRDAEMVRMTRGVNDSDAKSSIRAAV
jgi:hypothetical protein